MADMKEYFDRIKKCEVALQDPFVIIASLDSANGGREGVLTEVSRHQAAVLVAENKARLASTEEIEEYRNQVKAELEQKERRARAEALQAALLAKVLFKESGDED